MKHLKRIAFILNVVCIWCVIACVTGCVSPFYGTARIEKGFHMDAGLGVSRFITNDAEWILDCIGPRADVELRYGFSKYLGVNSRIGIGFGVTDVEDYLPIDEGPYLLADGAFGVQFTYPFEKNAPALRLELSYQPNIQALRISPVIFWGCGNPEWLTLGVRPTLFTGAEGLTVDAFTTFHPWQRWSIFAGLDVTSIFNDLGDGYPMATLGIGYKLK